MIHMWLSKQNASIPGADYATQGGYLQGDSHGKKSLRSVNPCVQGGQKCWKLKVTPFTVKMTIFNIYEYRLFIHSLMDWI